MKKKQIGLRLVAIVFACLLAGSCGEDGPRYGENLVENGSFEKVSDGMPEHWEITNFRGLQDMQPAEYGLTDSIAYDGRYSFYFRAGPGTKRFYTLAQDINVKGAKRIRIRGALLSRDCDESDGQYPQANFALTYYGRNRERFQSTRFADVRTDPANGSTDGWRQVDHVYRLPLGTETVAVHCVLGMSGEIWFDNVSVELPVGLPWHSIEGVNFTHYWLDKPYPEGSIEFQQKLFDAYAERLGIPPEHRPQISYYLYPDIETFRQSVDSDREIYVDYPRRTIHSIHPADNHEIVHLLTDSYGVFPKLLSEGTAFYLMDDFHGERIQPQAQRLLLAGELPPLSHVLDIFAHSRGKPRVMLPAAASFAGYLIEVGGASRFLELHTRCRVDMGYAAFAQAFEDVYGKPLVEVEKNWRTVLARADFSEAPAPEDGPDE